MPTTARGIWTPSDTDAVDFTTHLATMAGTIDTAITNLGNTVGSGANFYKGTAAQRASFLASATNGTAWQDTDGAKLLWVKDSSAWRPAFSLTGSGVTRFLDQKIQEFGVLAAAWTDVPNLIIKHTPLVATIYRLELTGRFVNGGSGTWRTGGGRFVVDGAVPRPVGELTTLDYPASGSWAQAVSELLYTAPLSAGVEHVFKVSAMASVAAAVVPKFAFTVSEIL